MKTNNSKDLQIGNIVRHERGWVGRVTAVEYVDPKNGHTMNDGDRAWNSSDEVMVDWFAPDAGLAAPRTSSIYLTKISDQ